MITGTKEVKVKSYCFKEGGLIEPEDGEEIIGMPYQWCSENSYPYIEHRKNGKVTKAINGLFIAVINFD